MSRLSLLCRLNRRVFRHSLLYRSTAAVSQMTLFQKYSSHVPTHPRRWLQSFPPSSIFFRHFSAALPGDGMELEMPALSPTMEKGSISSWLKKEGDRVHPGDAIAEIETDKATMEWELTDGGYLAKILAPAGTKDVSVGTCVAILVDEEKDVAIYKDYPSGISAPVAKEAPVEDKREVESVTSGELPPHTVIGFPALSPTMEIGGLGVWTKKEGDFIASGETICTVVTDKATNDFECLDEGYLAKILVKEGTEDLKVGTPIAVIVDDKDSLVAFKNYSAANVEKPVPPVTTEAPPKTDEKPTVVPPPPSPKPTSGDRIISSPYAKKLAAEANVSLIGVTGSGPTGRIVAADIHDLINRGVAVPSQQAVQAPFVDIQLTQIRRVTAERLLYSKQNVPHYYLTVECRVDELVRLRKALNAKLEQESKGVKLSINDFIIKAAALALRSVPEVNSSWQGDFIRQYNTADISIAMQTPIGLMVPIVKNAEKKGLQEISSEVKSLAQKAKEGKLRPEEFTGGTFTISNLGMYGINQFCAIVNPPQAAILAIGSTQSHLHQDSQTKELKEKSMMNCTLSCDHRVVDGAVGATWLKEFRNYLEQPLLMLL
eukprot:g5037.t1